MRQLIRQAREGVARAVDSVLTTLYWHIGLRILHASEGEARTMWEGDCLRAAETIDLDTFRFARLPR